MKKVVALVFVLSLLFALPAFAADTIKIGQIATITGEAAAYGAAEMESIKIAVDEINAAGGILGKQIELTMYDCATRQEDMVNAARRLVEQDQVVAVIGPSYSGLAIAASPVFTAARVPHIGTLPTNPLVTVDEDGNTRPYNFRICFLDPYQGRILATLAANELNLKKAAILHDVADEYSQGLREFFKGSFTQYGGEVVAEEGMRGEDVDFRSQLTNIKNSGADVLVFPFLGRALPLAVRQARELEIDAVIIGGDGYGDFMWEVAGDALRDTYWVTHVDRYDPDLAHFFEKYEELTGTECKEFMNAVLAYDAMYWLKDAIERAAAKVVVREALFDAYNIVVDAVQNAGGADPEEIRDTLYDAYNMVMTAPSRVNGIDVNSEQIRDALAATENLQLMHATLTMDEQHNPKDKDGVILRCDVEQQKALMFMRIRPD